MKYHFKKEKKVQNHVCMFGVVESFRIGCKTDGRSFGASRAARYVSRAVSSAVNPSKQNPPDLCQKIVQVSNEKKKLF